MNRTTPPPRGPVLWGAFLLGGGSLVAPSLNAILFLWGWFGGVLAVRAAHRSGQAVSCQPGRIGLAVGAWGLALPVSRDVFAALALLSPTVRGDVLVGMRQQLASSGLTGDMARTYLESLPIMTHPVGAMFQAGFSASALLMAAFLGDLLYRRLRRIGTAYPAVP